jgi:hypothetical protein
MDETKIEKLARLSGRVASKVAGALERRGYDIRGKISASISRVPRRAPAPKPKSNDRTTSDWLGRFIALDGGSDSDRAVESLAFGINDLCATGSLFSDQSEAWVLIPIRLEQVAQPLWEAAGHG